MHIGPTPSDHDRACDLAQLGELAEMAMALARKFHREAMAEPAPEPASESALEPEAESGSDPGAEPASLQDFAPHSDQEPPTDPRSPARPARDPARDFASAARIVTNIIALRHRIRRDQPFAGARSEAEQARDAARLRRREKCRRRGHIRSMVERAIDTPPNQRDAFSLRLDLIDRLSDDDIDAAYLEQPWTDIVLTICHDLGIVPSFKDWSDEDLRAYLGPTWPEPRADDGDPPAENFSPETPAPAHPP